MAANRRLEDGVIVLAYPGGPKMQSHVSLKEESRGRLDRHTEEIWSWSRALQMLMLMGVATRQGMPEATGSWRRQGVGSPLEPPEGE